MGRQIGIYQTRSAKSQNNNWPKINKLINKIYKLRTAWPGPSWLGLAWLNTETWLGLGSKNLS